MVEAIADKYRSLGRVQHVFYDEVFPGGPETRALTLFMFRWLLTRKMFPVSHPAWSMNSHSPKNRRVLIKAQSRKKCSEAKLTAPKQNKQVIYECDESEYQFNKPRLTRRRNSTCASIRILVMLVLSCVLIMMYMSHVFSVSNSNRLLQLYGSQGSGCDLLRIL